MRTVLTLNGGSSSIRYAFFDAAKPAQCVSRGKLERLDADHSTAATTLVDRLATEPLFRTVAAIGHRVVHGMHHADPKLITPALVEELQRITPFDPEHLPRELALIDAMNRAARGRPQVACFDTAFHRTMPRVATVLPIPRRYAAEGVQRYGFHGLSYTFLMAELRRLGDPAAARGRVVLAHLGSGASLAAVRDGASIDTTMGFTPTSGLVMGTRSGDLDPGVASFLALADGVDPAGFQRMVTHESGLLGVSQTSADVRDLLESEAVDERAAEALALFCYQIKKHIGAAAAALGGIDTLVFAGGIGENSPVIRARICDGLQFLGIQLGTARNANAEAIASDDSLPVTVRIIRTDEEAVIAAQTLEVIDV